MGPGSRGPCRYKGRGIPWDKREGRVKEPRVISQSLCLLLQASVSPPPPSPNQSYQGSSGYNFRPTDARCLPRSVPGPDVPRPDVPQSFPSPDSHRQLFSPSTFTSHCCPKEMCRGSRWGCPAFWPRGRWNEGSAQPSGCAGADSPVPHPQQPHSDVRFLPPFCQHCRDLWGQ